MATKKTFRTLDMAVRKLLPPNGRIREFDGTVAPGVQQGEDYFVVKLDAIYDKVISDKCAFQLAVYPVLQDVSRDNTKLDCFVYGSRYNALECELSRNLISQGRYSAPGAFKDRTVWIVFHLPFVLQYKFPKEESYPFYFVVDDTILPDSSFWLLWTSYDRPKTSQNSNPSPSLGHCTSPSSQPVSSQRFFTTFFGSTLHSSNYESASSVSKSPTSSTFSSDEQSSSNESASSVSKRHTSSTFASDVQSSSNKSASSVSKRHTSSTVSSSRRPPPFKRYKYSLEPLSAGMAGEKIFSVGVVTHVELGRKARTGTIYDILKVTDETSSMTDSRQTSFTVKVFHNDKADWSEDGKPAKGQVLVFKNMMCRNYMGNRDFTVYSTKLVHICTQDDNKQLVWLSHSKKCPDDIEGVKDEVMKLFDWWAGYNEIVPQFSSHAAGLPQQQSSHSSSSVSTQNIAVEEVVQCFQFLEPKLQQLNLNMEVLKHITQLLQAKNDQDWMRTNTICQGEIADNLDPDVQQNCEGSTFLHYVTNKIMPNLCMLIQDPNKDVRDAVFKVKKFFVNKIKKVSEATETKM